MRTPSQSSSLSHYLAYGLSQRLATIILGGMCIIMPVTATFAEPTTPNSQTNNSSQNTTQDTTQTDPQVANTATSPFITDPNSPLAATNSLPNPLNNPNTLASQIHPTDNALSQANQELLSHNAQLQRDINDLQTQVNVLINERSGQLYMYGAVTVIASLLIGLFIGWLLFGRRDRW